MCSMWFEGFYLSKNEMKTEKAINCTFSQFFFMFSIESIPVGSLGCSIVKIGSIFVIKAIFYGEKMCRCHVVWKIKCHLMLKSVKNIIVNLQIRKL